MEISHKNEKFQKILLNKIVKDIFIQFLKICGQIFGNIWNYFTNISKNI